MNLRARAMRYCQDEASPPRPSAVEVHGPSCEKPQIRVTGDALGFGSMIRRKNRGSQSRRSALRPLTPQPATFSVEKCPEEKYDLDAIGQVSPHHLGDTSWAAGLQWSDS